MGLCTRIQFNGDAILICKRPDATAITSQKQVSVIWKIDNSTCKEKKKELEIGSLNPDK